MDKKLISVVVPTYNEQENVVPLTDTLVKIFAEELPEYNYEIIFIDNHSKDNTKTLIRQICSENPNVKAIFNARNFGQMRSPVYGFKQAYGDCVVRLNADFQDPPSLIPTFVRRGLLHGLCPETVLQVPSEDYRYRTYRELYGIRAF